MDLKDIKHIYFLGIGGIGMSALARYFHAMRITVGGYDKTSTRLTDELIAEGMLIHFEDNIELVPPMFRSLNEDEKKNILIVYTPAVPKDHSEFVFFNIHGFNIKKRAEVLGLITDSAYTLAVAGTHGKTTTSSLVAHILKTAGREPSAFLGGITKNYGTNLLLNKQLAQLPKEKNFVVVEADEYDRSFLTLHPEIAVITSIDADHLDIYGDKRFVEESYTLFANQVRSTLILKKSFASQLTVNKKYKTYSLNDSTADYHTGNLHVEDGNYHFDLHTPTGIIKDLSLGLPGRHNVENAVAASAVSMEAGIESEQLRKALADFQGVRRRFDYQVKTNKQVFIDDYAHHPEELKATISSVKEMYPGKKITGIFQPHLFSRTRDFADDFAKSLDLLDACILLEIYPARELPIDGVNSQMLIDRMKLKEKMICSKAELVETVINKRSEVVLAMGAGDIDTFVEPIKNRLLQLQ